MVPAPPPDLCARASVFQHSCVYAAEQAATRESRSEAALVGAFDVNGCLDTARCERDGLSVERALPMDVSLVRVPWSPCPRVCGSVCGYVSVRVSVCLRACVCLCVFGCVSVSVSVSLCTRA